MLEYTIQILKKVSFNSDLFNKELLKALKILLPSEIDVLKRWVRRFTENKPYLKNSLSLIN